MAARMMATRSPTFPDWACAKRASEGLTLAPMRPAEGFGGRRKSCEPENRLLRGDANGGGSPRLPIDKDCMAAAFAVKLAAMLPDMPDEIAAFHATGRVRV